MAAKTYRLGVDVGGTHTDLVLLDVADGTLAVEKVATTPKNPALGIMRGIGNFAARGVDLSGIEFFSHGTTITTNALLEMRGAKVGLLINRGFRAIQETQGQARDGNVFDYFFQKPPPIAPQSLTREIGGRIDYAGAVLEPLDEDAVRACGGGAESRRRRLDRGVLSVRLHESRARRAHRRADPRDFSRGAYFAVVARCCRGCANGRACRRHCSMPIWRRCWSPISPIWRTRLNAAGVTTQQRFLMQSNGGVMPFAAAVTGHKTVHSLLSGPAAGAQASAYLPRDDAGSRGIVTLDMGGTSCDIAFIEGGAPLEVTEGTVARRQLDVPALDLTTISAGGGSIVWIDRAGFLSVGPQSAGADPGPVCYGRGGDNPTVTDADIVCGLLNPDYFLGGTQKLDAAAARAALETKIATPMKMTVAEAAAGIRRIVDMRMADEVRVFAARRGVDLERVRAVAVRRRRRGACRRGRRGARHAPHRRAGAAGRVLGARPALHRRAARLHPLRARRARPARSGPRRADCSARSRPRRRASLPKKASTRAPPCSSAISTCAMPGRAMSCACRLSGLWQDALDGQALKAARERFDEVHAKIHGHAAKEKSVEVVSYRLRVRVAVPKYAAAGLAGRRAVIAAAGCGQRHAARVVRCRQGARRRRFTIATSYRSASPSPAPPSSSSSTPRRSCRPAGTPPSIATAI